jgi:transcription initiation factor TFIIIB Brf1 subunit/transcription initiation factor TFIIB
MLNIIGSSSDYNYDLEDKPHICDGSNGGSLFTKHHSMPKDDKKTIRSDLEKLPLPDSIIGKAEEVFQKMTKIGTKRSKRRKRLIFFCIHSAYDELGIPVEPNHLANICGIERCDISKSMSMCAQANTDYDAPLVNRTPQGYIKGYFKKLNEEGMTFEDEALDCIYDLMDEVLELDAELYEEKPPTVAAAILVFYLELENYVIDKSKYKSIFGVSDMTVNKIKNRIKRVYNE